MSSSLRIVLFLFLAVPLLLSACVSGSTTPAPRERESVQADRGYVELSRSDRVYTDSLVVDVAGAWSRLPSVYRVLGLPVMESDAVARRIAVSAFQVRPIEDTPLSRYFDCGRGITAGPNADSYAVFVWVETRIVPSAADPTKGTVATSVTANARPVAARGNEVGCVSLGRLERRISELIQTGER